MSHPKAPGPDAGQPRPPLSVRLKRLLVGPPRDLTDRSLFRHLSLVPFLAWVGLGADGLSSSAYGPEEAFITLGQHVYLAVALAGLTAFTVLVISSAYSRIIEEFPHGGGGYVVATKLLGERAGLVSGTALLVDYVLTITVSIAAAGDALFSFLPPDWQPVKLSAEVFFIFGLTVLNIRGVRESVLVLAPVFVLFLITHLVLIGGGILVKAPEMGSMARAVGSGFRSGYGTLGLGGLLLLFVHAYSLGGGTYTGIEAVSNGLPIMREPKVETARRTMVYMGTSLAITASGLLLCYLLWDLRVVKGKTMNAVLVEGLMHGVPGGPAFVVVTLIAEGALLVVAAQAGFIDGPRVLANMALDSWVPRRFAALSERLTTQNGILLMGGASLAALLYTGGDVRHIVVMYSINVFLTFSLSMFAMTRLWWARRGRARWKRRAALFTTGFFLCATILLITVSQKFREGGWLTLAVTGGLVAVCFKIRAHYREVAARLRQLYGGLEEVPRREAPAPPAPDGSQPTAVVLVASYGGLGIHTLLNIFRMFPDYYRNVVFLSVGVIDSGAFKGEAEVDALRARTEEMLKRYLDLARGLGLAAAIRFKLGTDVVDEAEALCREVTHEFPRSTFFTGKVLFEKERWYQRFLHNETAYAIQKRLRLDDKLMVVIPARVPEERARRPWPVS